MRELDKILDQDEKVFWEGKPKFLPFFLSSSLFTIIFGLIWLGLLSPFILAAINSIAQGKSGWLFFLMPHFWIGLIFVLGIPMYVALVHKYMYYAITNKRIIIQKGLIGRDFEAVDFDKITNAEVNVGVFDKLFGRNTGSILVSTAGSFTYTRHGPVQKPYTLRNVENPYDVFKILKKVSHAVKTDIYFPNEYRPKSNPGYKTEYKL